MIAAFGIAEPDDFHALFGIENSVLAAIAGDIRAFGVEEFGGGGGSAGGEEQEGDEGMFHRGRVMVEG